MAVLPSTKHNFALSEHLMGKKVKNILNKLDHQLLFYINKTDKTKQNYTTHLIPMSFLIDHLDVSITFYSELPPQA